MHAPGVSMNTEADYYELLGVERTADEGGLGAQRQRHRVERGVDRAHRRGLGDLADLRRRRVLTLGETVDPVVEQQDRQVDVAPERVHEVVAADGQRVAVPGDDPDRQVRTRCRQPGRDRRRPAVDRVHAVGVHVVREPAGAPDPGDEHDVLPAQAQLRQEALDGGQHGVVAAPRAPAHLLVRLEVRGLLRRRILRHPAQAREPEIGAGHWPSWAVMTSVIAPASSSARNGRPRTAV